MIFTSVRFHLTHFKYIIPFILPRALGAVRKLMPKDEIFPKMSELVSDGARAGTRPCPLCQGCGLTSWVLGEGRSNPGPDHGASVWSPGLSSSDSPRGSPEALLTLVSNSLSLRWTQTMGIPRKVVGSRQDAMKGYPISQPCLPLSNLFQRIPRGFLILLISSRGQDLGRLDLF